MQMPMQSESLNSDRKSTEVFLYLLALEECDNGSDVAELVWNASGLLDVNPSEVDSDTLDVYVSEGFPMASEGRSFPLEFWPDYRRMMNSLQFAAV